MYIGQKHCRSTVALPVHRIGAVVTLDLKPLTVAMAALNTISMAFPKLGLRLEAGMVLRTVTMRDVT